MDIEARRKRLLWQATHRGLKEMDVLLGGFARAEIGAMSLAELEQLEAIVGLADQDLLAWFMMQAAVPPRLRGPVMDRLLAYRP
jgi:antitoxin CptB